MGAPNSGPSGKKFTNSDVLAAFNEENRRRVGKIELTVKEVTEILNEKILPDGTTVTRQAVDNRLNKLVGDKLVRSKHGRSYLYRRPDDIERLFSEPTHTSAPAGGGAPPNERGKEFQMSSTSFLANLGNNQGQIGGRAMSDGHNPDEVPWTTAIEFIEQNADEFPLTDKPIQEAKRLARVYDDGSKSPKTIAAGAVYWASLLRNEKLVQDTVAEIMDVHEVSVRNGYRYIANGEGYEIEPETDLDDDDASSLLQFLERRVQWTREVLRK